MRLISQTTAPPLRSPARRRARRRTSCRSGTPRNNWTALSPRTGRRRGLWRTMPGLATHQGPARFRQRIPCRDQTWRGRYRPELLPGAIGGPSQSRAMCRCLQSEASGLPCSACSMPRRVESRSGAPPAHGQGPAPPVPGRHP